MDAAARHAALQRWMALFNEQAYYEAHEVVEEVWHALRGGEREFWKGLVHASVALCHYQRGNGHGARVKSRSAVHYLTPCAPAHEGLDVEALLADLERFFAPLREQPPRTAPPAAEWWPVARWRGPASQPPS
jgi:predicted metal-dependent hydrolase